MSFPTPVANNHHPRVFTPRPPPVHIPYEATLYDQSSHAALIKAQEYYLDLYSSCIAENSETITNETLLGATRVAEAFLYNFSMKFGVVGPTGTMLHLTYKDEPTRKEDSAVRVAEVFCMLNIMLSHPIYQMLRTVYCVVYPRSKPYAALRDVRWTYQSTKNKLSIVGGYEVFHSLVTMLREFVHNAVTANDTEISRRAHSDFYRFAVNENDGSTLVDDLTWGTSVMLAITVLECSNRSSRQVTN